MNVGDFDELFYCLSQHPGDLGTSFISYYNFLSSRMGSFAIQGATMKWGQVGS
jgi:hypothetical protein